MDVRLGGNFSTLKPTDTAPVLAIHTLKNDGMGYYNETIHDEFVVAIDPTEKTSFQFIPRQGDQFLLMPGEFVLASLLEDIELPPNIYADIRGKSSLGRLGLDNSSPAGLVDGGWSGVLTIELSNHGTCPILLTKGMKIGQMVFHRTACPDRSYKETGRYYKQSPGQGSLGL